MQQLLPPYVRKEVADQHDQPEGPRAGLPAVYSAVPNVRRVIARIRRDDSGAGTGGREHLLISAEASKLLDNGLMEKKLSSRATDWREGRRLTDGLGAHTQGLEAAGHS